VTALREQSAGPRLRSRRGARGRPSSKPWASSTSLTRRSTLYEPRRAEATLSSARSPSPGGHLVECIAYFLAHEVGRPPHYRRGRSPSSRSDRRHPFSPPAMGGESVEFARVKTLSASEKLRVSSVIAAYVGVRERRCRRCTRDSLSCGVGPAGDFPGGGRATAVRSASPASPSAEAAAAAAPTPPSLSSGGLTENPASGVESGLNGLSAAAERRPRSSVAIQPGCSDPYRHSRMEEDLPC